MFGGNNSEKIALNLIQNSNQGFLGSIPNKLANLSPPDASNVKNTRLFQLNVGNTEELAALSAAWGNICGGSGMGINGQPMNMDRIDEKVRKGDTEIWKISVDDQMHPFHIHGCSFRIFSQQGVPAPAYAQGWKDMVHVENGCSEVLVKFDYEAPRDAPYMYHCHILEHVDCGMMGQFTVT